MVERVLFRGIARKFLFWFLVVAVVPLILSSVIITTEMVWQSREDISTELSVIRDMKVSQMRMWLAEKETDVNVMADDTSLRELVEALRMVDSAKREPVVEKIREIMQSRMALKLDFIQFFLIDARDGKVVASTDHLFEQKNRSNDTMFTVPMQTGDLFVKDIYRSEYMKGKPSMTISAPVFCLEHGGRDAIAVIVGRLDLESSLFPLLKDRTGLGKTGETLIVNRDGMALSNLMFSKDAQLRLKITAEPAWLAATGETGVVESLDYRKERVLAAYTYLPETGWGFVAKKDLSEVYAPIWSLVMRVLLIGAGFLLLTVALALLISRGLARPLIAMSGIAGRIAEGDLGARNPENGRVDEIGLLARSINRMADSLQSRFRLLEGLSGMMEAAMGSSERQGFSSGVLKVLMKRTQAHMGVFYVLLPDGLTLQPAFAVGMEPAAWEPMECGSLEGILGLSSLSDDVTRINQLSGASPFMFRGPGGVAEAREIMAVPLSAPGRIEGLICLGSLTGFSEDDETLVRESRRVLATGLDRVLVSERVGEMTGQLQARNEELQAQSEELREQSEELLDQNVELEQQRRQVEDANRLKSEFLSNMSHELRTPLNSILALSRVLMRKKMERLGEEEVKYLDVIERNGRQLLELINDILDLSKIESGRLDVHPALFSISECIQSLVEVLQPVATEKGLSLDMDVPEDLPPIRSDEARVSQILRNLLSNAVKFTSDGGVGIVVRKEGEKFVIQVRDTGIGIPAEDFPFLFDEFRQADGSAARRFEGTGLGLAIARKSALLLGGSIDVESVVGEGSVFTVRLPLYWNGPPVEDVLAEEEPLELLRHTILVVDDDPQAAGKISSLLELEGYRVAVANKGPEALRLARTLKLSAITLDLIMPDMDGWEVLQHLKDDPATRDIPVVIISVSKESETAFALGAVGYLTKPVSRQDLVAEVRKVCGNELCRVLVADDNEIDRAELARVLEKDGYSVSMARDGQECLEMIESGPPDILVLDLVMPRMDGFQVLEHLRNGPRSDLPVIIVTAKDLSLEERTRLQSFARSVLSKEEAGYEGVASAVARLKRIPEAARGAGRSANRTILIVEDNEVAVAQVKSLIQDESLARVDVAKGGRQALEYMMRNTPDAIILDLSMPDIDGFAVLDQMRGAERTAHIPVLILTARDLTKKDLSRLRNNNVQHLVQKGDVNREELLKKVRLLLGKTEPRPVDLRPDILAVEDNSDNITTLRAILGERYSSAWALNGEDGLEKARELRPRVILLDLTLPDMNGFEVLSSLKADVSTRSIPVVVVTARAMKGDREKAIEAGGEAYITKPIDQDALLAVLGRLLG